MESATFIRFPEVSFQEVRKTKQVNSYFPIWRPNLTNSIFQISFFWGWNLASLPTLQLCQLQPCLKRGEEWNSLWYAKKDFWRQSCGLQCNSSGAYFQVLPWNQQPRKSGVILETMWQNWEWWKHFDVWTFRSHFL